MFFRQQQRLTLFTYASQQWQSSWITFRVGCSPERHFSHYCRFVKSDHENVSTIRNFTTVMDTKRPSLSSSSPLPSPHYLMAIRSSLFFTLVVKRNSRRCCNYRFSTNANSSSSNNSDDTTTNTTMEKKTPPPTASVVASSLRRMIKPFLLKCHPDIQQHHHQPEISNEDDDDKSSISKEDAGWAKAINLRAIQNLNSYLDSIQTLLIESSSSSSSVRRSPKNVSSSSSLVEIDFVIAVQSSSSSSLKSGGKKRHQSRRNRGIEWHQSRRKVQLVLPQRDKSDVSSMSFLERHVHSELVRLLRVAGLEVPSYSFHLLQHHDDYNRQDRGGQGANDATYPKGPFWHDDDGLQSYHFPFGGGASNKSGRVAATSTSASSSIFSRYKANREQYVRDTTANENWNDELYNSGRFQYAMAESLIEDETRGLIANDAARRQDLIARILAKVQIQKQQKEQKEEEEEEPSSSTSKNDDDDTAAAGAAATNSRIVVVDDAGLEQLLAMRRLSLVLDDNFQVLQLEELGRLWENLTLVLLLPSWDNDDNDYNDVDNNDDNNAPTATIARRRMRRTKRRRRQQQQQQLQLQHGMSTILEEGMDYAWTLHPDWSVTMHIPMDFEPDELVQELERNVQDFNRLLEEQTYHHYGGGGGGFYSYNNHDSSSSSSAAAV